MTSRAPEMARVARLGVVGRGRVGTALAAAFRDAGLDVDGPAGRGEVPAGCDAILLCVPDSAIPEAAAAVAGAAPLVGHTSGATRLAALAPAGVEAFGLHPLQTITGPGTSLAGCGCAVAGSTAAAYAAAGAMRTVRSVAELREALPRDGRIGLVPTMGYFHEGHLELMRRARAGCDFVVVSLFVNPAQFAPGEDLAAYPRDEERDSRLAEGEGVDLLFAPPPEEVYPPGFSTYVEVEGLTDVLEGDPAQRVAAHFRGVTTVVAKLFNMVVPDAAYFGQKDAQQA